MPTCPQGRRGACCSVVRVVYSSFLLISNFFVVVFFLFGFISVLATTTQLRNYHVSNKIYCDILQKYEINQSKIHESYPVSTTCAYKNTEENIDKDNDIRQLLLVIF